MDCAERITISKSVTTDEAEYLADWLLKQVKAKVEDSARSKFLSAMRNYAINKEKPGTTVIVNYEITFTERELIDALADRKR